MASQVQPPLTDKKVIIIFMNTLCDPYYNMLVGNGTLNFNDLAISDEMIKYSMKSGKINVERKEGSIPQKNEETQVVFPRNQLSGGHTPY